MHDVNYFQLGKCSRDSMLEFRSCCAPLTFDERIPPGRQADIHKRERTLRQGRADGRKSWATEGKGTQKKRTHYFELLTN